MVDHLVSLLRLNFDSSEIKYPNKMQRFSLLALLALVAVASANRDLYQGVRIPGDEILEQKKIDVDSKILRVVEHTETILAKPNFKITRVEVVDLKGDDTSATPRILSGGQYDTFVAVKFTSERGHGIHFILKVYGKRA